MASRLIQGVVLCQQWGCQEVGKHIQIQKCWHGSWWCVLRVMPVGWWTCCCVGCLVFGSFRLCLFVPLFWIGSGWLRSFPRSIVSLMRHAGVSGSMDFRVLWRRLRGCLVVFWFWLFWQGSSQSVELCQSEDFGRWDQLSRSEWGRSKSCFLRCSVPARLLRWIIFGLSVRIGEASLPGPSGASDRGDGLVQFEIGICNPNGLFDKGHFLADSSVDMWAMSETHLSSKSLKAFRGLLRSQAGHYGWMVHGKPVLPRHLTSEVGLYSGVAVVSQWPTHALPHDWAPLVYATGRLCVVTSFVRGLWISGCVVYGTPCGPTHPQAKKTTESLVLAGFERILQLSGPRYVCGDFNHDHSKLETVALMRRAGFVDLQDLQFERHGTHPVATCRGKTRRDFCFVSPELASLFSSCRVVDHDWSDHSALVGTFELQDADRWRHPWPLPDKIPWSSLAARSEGSAISFASPVSVDDRYVQLWQQVEEGAYAASVVAAKPLPPKCFGRGSRTKPLSTRFQVAPLRESRPGDVRPVFLGFSQIHRQWFRQLRRLESYKRVVRHGLSAGCAEHRVELWTSILRAPGFCPSFAVWWSLQPFTCGLVPEVPGSSPDFAVAEQLFNGLQHEVRILESHLRKHQSYVRSLKKQSGIAALYSEVRRDPPAPAELLIKPVTGIVSQVDEDLCAVEFQHDHHWDPSRPFVHAGVPFQPHVVTSDKLFVEDVSPFKPGDVVVQTQCKGKLDELFQAFHDQWSVRWQRHDFVQSSQWNDILTFASTVLRPVASVIPPLTPGVFREMVRGKQSKSARGLDGVSKCDLLSLSSPQVDSILSLYARAESDGTWPKSCMAGSVRSLAKTSLPQSAGDFRPVTVLSLVYRIWSSYHSKFWLKELGAYIDPLLCGNRPGGRTSHVWRWILQEVETAYQTEAPVSGFVADLVKAFNTLPRLPTLHAARLMGVGHETVTGWAGALSSIRRHFAVRQSFSSGLDSSTGLPEGCGLSCLGMLILDELLHRWLAALSPDVCGLTFVDNWEVVVRQEQWLAPAYERLEKFVKMLDLQLDEKKTYFWSTSPCVRARLRQEGKNVLSGARDLGAHVVYTKQLANATVTNRINELATFWDKLTVASGSFAQKVRVVLTAAWPRASHASSAVVIGRRHIDWLRSRYMQAMKVAKPGASPWLQFAFESDGVDPQQWILLDTFRSFRDVGGVSSLSPQLDLVVQAESSYVPGSITEILYQRIHQLGWEVTTGTCVRDSIGVFDLLQIDWVQLVRRVHIAWTKVIARKVSHRHAFTGFEAVDREATKKGLLACDEYSQGILRRFLNGSCITNSISFRWTKHGNDKCVVCGASDTLEHRLWRCPGSQEDRDALEPWVLDASRTMPVVARDHGWTLASSLQEEWWKYLTCLPTAVPPISLTVAEDCIMDVFTDGSCLWQDQVAFRIASYAVVLAPQLTFGPSGNDFQILTAEPLAGMVQTSYRAELMGLVAALTHALTHRWFIRVWTDCQSVVTKFLLVSKGLRVLKSSQPHYDLWIQAMSLAEEIGFEKVQVIKVPAHLDEKSAMSAFESWMVQGNGIADQAAKTANCSRPTVFWRFWERHSREALLNQLLGQALRAHLVNVTVRWNEREKVAHIPDLVESSYGSGRRIPAMEWTPRGSVQLVGRTLIKRFGLEFSQHLLDWFNTLWDSQAELRWISYVQLFVLYQQTFRDAGVGKQDGRWFAFRTQAGSTPEQFPYRLLLKWFRLLIQQLLKDTKTSFVSCITRPRCAMLCCHIGCLAIPLRAELEAQAEEWLVSHLDRPVRGQGSTLSLPTIG